MNETDLVKIIFNFSSKSSKSFSKNSNKITLEKLQRDYSGYTVPPSLINEIEAIKSSYIAGIIFMMFVIVLLLYVNLYYEYCFRDAIIELSKTRMCSCLKNCFVVRRRGKRQQIDTEQIDNATSQNLIEYQIETFDLNNSNHQI
jgi:hypothetical protein